MTLKASYVLFKLYRIYKARKKHKIPQNYIVRFDAISSLQKKFPKISPNDMYEIFYELKKNNYVTYREYNGSIEKIRLTKEGILYCKQLPKAVISRIFKITSALSNRSDQSEL